MCGLAAIHLAPRERSTTQWKQIQHLFTENLIANEERGRDATGIALISAKGERIILKKSLSASRFSKTKEYQQFWNHLDANTICLLGHTRKPTKGNPDNNVNNHPIQVNSIIGIHNGEIQNDNELFAFGKFNRLGEVDSEIIFQMLNEVNPKALTIKQYLAQTAERIQHFQGNFTFFFVDLRKPSRLLLIKKDQPLSLHWENELQALFFSSRYFFLRRKFGTAVIHTSLPYNQGYCFDSYLLPTYRANPVYSFPINDLAYNP